MQLWANYLVEVMIIAGFAVSLNLLLGYAGQLSIAHAAFGSVGGYAVGYLTTAHDWPFLTAVAVGVIAAAVLGAAVAVPAMRLSDDYLILLTIAVAFVVTGVFTTLPALGGAYGIIGIPPPTLRGVSLDRPMDWLVPSTLVLGIVYLTCHRIGESPFGRVLKSIRENQDVGRSLGKDVVRAKVAVFSISAGFAGLSGALLSGWLRLASPGLFDFDFALTLFAVVIIGGAANLGGSIVGAVIIVALQPAVRRLSGLDETTSATLVLVVYGIGMLAIMLVRPRGLVPEGTRLTAILADHVRPTSAHGPPSTCPGGPTTAAGRQPASAAARPSSAIDSWTNAPTVVEVRGLSKTFGGVVAADDLQFELRRGAIAALVGPNGAGKTTVFNLLTGFVRPDGGSVRLQGTELVGRSPHEVARAGMVRSFQDVRLVGRLSCLDNVALAVPAQSGESLRELFFRPRASDAVERVVRARAMRWLEFVGMADHSDELTGTLSYGQSKLISIARLLASDAPVLLIDEPASGVDSRWVDEIMALVRAVREEGRTVCIVEHNLSVVQQLADHTYFMEAGRITAQGAIADLMSDPALNEAYFGSGHR